MLKTKQTNKKQNSFIHKTEAPVALFRFVCYNSQKVEYLPVIMEVRIELRAYRAVIYPLLS